MSMSKMRALRHLKGDAHVADLILKAIVKAQGNKEAAAEQLELGYSSLHRYIDQLGIREKIEAACADKGFRVLKGRAPGAVDTAIREAIVEGRRSRDVEEEAPKPAPRGRVPAGQLAKPKKRKRSA